MLKGLLQDFKLDLQDAQLNISLYESSTSAIDILLGKFRKNEPYNDSLSTYFAMSTIIPRFISNSSSYEALKSVGVNLISNDRLRRQILKISDFTYESIKTWEAKYSHNDQFILEN